MPFVRLLVNKKIIPYLFKYLCALLKNLFIISEPIFPPVVSGFLSYLCSGK